MAGATSSHAKDARDRILEEMKQDGFAVARASKELRANKEIMLAVVRESPILLPYASPELRADREVVLAAVSNNGAALEFASEELRADKDIVMSAVRTNGLAFWSASWELQADRDIVCQVMSLCGDALGCVSEQLQGDKDVVLKAVRQNGIALEYASEELQADKEVVLEAVRQDGCALEYADEELRADYEVVLEAVKQDGYAWQYAALDIRADQDLLLLAARRLRTDDAKYKYLPERQAIVDQGVPERVIEAAIAVQGEEAPVVSVTLIRDLGAGPRTSIGRGEGGSGGPDSTSSDWFRSEVTLLSGTCFTCSLPDYPGNAGQGANRLGPNINDLASKLVDELPQYVQMVDLKRVFMSFRLNDHGDVASSSPWEWDRPLTNVLWCGQSEQGSQASGS